MGPTSCLTPEKGKVPSVEFTAFSQVRVGAGQDGGRWISPPHSSCHTLGIQARGETAGREKDKGETQEGSGPGNKHQELSRNSGLLP